MKYEKKIYLSFLWILLGFVLIICRAAGILQNDMWQGIGYGWLACGIVQTVKQIRYRKDKDYREKYDIAQCDERNKFISQKAWALAGYGFVLAAGAVAVICLCMGKRELASIASYGLCLIVFLYWISYVILRKRY